MPPLLLLCMFFLIFLISSSKQDESTSEPMSPRVLSEPELMLLKTADFWVVLSLPFPFSISPIFVDARSLAKDFLSTLVEDLFLAGLGGALELSFLLFVLSRFWTLIGDGLLF